MSKLFAAAVGVLAILAITAPRNARAQTHTNMAQAHATIDEDGTCIECTPMCQPGWVLVEPGTTYKQHGLGPGPSCKQASCPGISDCGGFGMTTQKLDFIVALARRNSADLVTLVASDNKLFSLNVFRNALQIRGCGDGIIASIPLGKAQFRSLMVATAGRANSDASSSTIVASRSDR